MSEIDVKPQIASIHAFQGYEWLPYTHGEEVPVGEKRAFCVIERYENNRRNNRRSET